MKVLARIFSYVFHPLLLVTYTFLFLMWFNPFAFGSPDFKGAVSKQDINLILIFVCTALLPFIMIFMMKFLELLVDLNMEDPKDRIGPYISSGMFYLWIFFNVNSNPQLPPAFKIFTLGATIALFLAFFLNNFTRISVYTVGMGTMIGTVMLNWLAADPLTILGIFQIVLIIAGIMGTARLSLKASKTEDLYGGYFVGFIAQFIAGIIFTVFL